MPRCTSLVRSLFVLTAHLIAVEAAAQFNTAEIRGLVKDPRGGVLVGASVMARHDSSGLRSERVTDNEGRFFLPALPVGDYVLEVGLAGFSPFVQRGLALSAGQTLDVSVTLQLGPLSDAVTVTAVAPILRTTNAEISDVVDGRRVVDLPINSRQFLQFAQLAPNAVIPPGGTRGAALEQAGSLPNVAGQRSGHNIYLVDGVKVTDEYFNNLVISPSLEAIQEFTIRESMYPAEFGGKASALINVVTKSGGNRVHGSALEFARSDRLDARNYFDDPARPVPPLSQHQFAGTVGGPLRRDRAFYFLSYEGQRVRRSLTQTFSVPTDALRRGNFAGLSDICDPLTRTASGACTPFPDNRIPAERIDPVARGLLTQVPLPGSSGLVQNLLAVREQVTPMNQFSVRLDHRLDSGDTLFGRVTGYHVRDEQPFGTSALNETLVPGFGRIVTTSSRNLALGHTRAFGSRWLNELRFGYLGVSGGQQSPNEGADVAARTGLQGVTADPRDTGYPQVSFGGAFSTIGDPTTFVSRSNRSYELYDNVLLERGAHHIKFGGYLFGLRFNPVNPNNARGAFTFTGQWSGNAFADFLLGYPSAASVGIGRADEHGRSTWLHVYGQDNWQARPNLTIDYGLRYEINGQMNDVDARLSSIDLSVPGGRFVIASDDRNRISPSAQPLLSQIPIPYVTSADAGWTPALLRPSYRRVAPRVGAAWTLGQDGHTVLAGGLGVYLNQWAYSVQQALAQTLPFFFAKTVNAPVDAVQPTLYTPSALLAPASGSVGGNTMNWDFRTEYAKNYSLSLQRQLGGSTALSVTLLRSAIVGADSSTVINVPEPGPGPIGPRRPVPQLSNITSIRWDGYSIYNGITVRVDRRLSRGLAFTAHYTRSQAIDDASDPGATTHESNLPQDVRNMAAENARASFDHRHRFVGNVMYALPNPGGGGWLSRLGSGWHANAIVTLQSGAPFTVNLAVDRANIGSGPAQRPDAVCDPNSGGARTPQQWFNTACFALPALFTFGNAARNSVLAPGYGNVDVALQKDVRLSPRARLQLRYEVFNLLNRANFDVPNRVAFTPNFGRIFSAGPARQMQLGARLQF